MTDEHVDICKSVSFKIGIMTNTTKFYSLIPVFNDLDFHLKSQGFMKSITSAVIFMHTSVSILIKFC